MLRQHLHLGEHRHEVRVAGLAGDDVLVHMVDDAGAGDAAEVPTEVVTLGLGDGGEGAEALRGETEEAALLFVRSLDVFESPRSPELPGHGAGAYAACGGATQSQRL